MWKTRKASVLVSIAALPITVKLQLKTRSIYYLSQFLRVQHPGVAYQWFWASLTTLAVGWSCNHLQARLWPENLPHEVAGSPLGSSTAVGWKLQFFTRQASSWDCSPHGSLLTPERAICGRGWGCRTPRQTALFFNLSWRGPTIFSAVCFWTHRPRLIQLEENCLRARRPGESPWGPLGWLPQHLNTSCLYNQLPSWRSVGTGEHNFIFKQWIAPQSLWEL